MEIKARDKVVLLSDHALMRFAEREIGFNLKGLRFTVGALLKDKTVEEIRALGFRLNGRKIVSYIPTRWDQAKQVETNQPPRKSLFKRIFFMYPKSF